ncbi:transcriptional regulator [Salmonella enterica]|nr:transcriptional regulator [Salmonella enterica]
MNNECLSYPGELLPGSVDVRHFRLLVTLCNIHNPRIQKSLEDVFVYGKKRQEACKDNLVAPSYFSIKYHRMQMVNQTVTVLCNYIMSADRRNNDKANI